MIRRINNNAAVLLFIDQLFGKSAKIYLLTLVHLGSLSLRSDRSDTSISRYISNRARV